MFQCCMFVGFLWNKMVWSKTRYVRLLLSHSVTHPDICTVSRETVKTWVVCTPDHAVRLRASARGSCSVCDLRNVTFSELWSDVQPSCSCLQYMLNIWRISWEIWKYVHVSQTEHRNHSLTVVEAAFRDFTQVKVDIQVQNADFPILEWLTFILQFAWRLCHVCTTAMQST